MRKLCLIAGLLLLVAGLVWAAQGAGLFPYPRQSFMIGASQWITYGLGTAAVGAVLAILSRKL